MAITDAKKVDYLWKKLGYGATKTDTNDNKKAPNEAIASPLLLNGANTWNQASSIPTVLPGSSSGVVTVYPTSSPHETTADGTATANRTWKTGLIDWIPPEIGSTYQVKVYIHTASDAGNAAASGDQVFATGSGNNDEWFFDYQSGVLHFIGTNLPNGISFTGKSVYISGGRYTGQKGLQNISGGGGSGLTFVGDDSAGIEIADGGSVYIQGGIGIQTSANSDGTITITNTGTSVSSLSVFGDDSTNMEVDLNNQDLTVSGGNSITTSTSSTQTLTVSLDPNIYVNNISSLDSTGINVNNNLYVNGQSVITQGDNISSLTNDAGYITSADVFELTVSDDASTTQTFTKTDTFNIQGAQNITTSLSGDTLTITGPDLTSYLTDTTLNVVADDSQTISVNNGGTIQFSGGTNITTSTSSEGVVTIDGPDLTSYIQSGDNISSLTNDAGYITSANLTFVGDDSVGTTLNLGETLQLEGDNKISVVVEEDSTIGNSRVKFTTTTTFTQDSAPTGAKDGDRWFDTDSGNEYVYVVEGSSAHWIETGTSGSTINVSQLDSVDSILFAVDDSGSTSAATSETLSILGDGRISTDLGGDKEIRITTTAANVETGDSAPSNPRDGDLWYNSSNGNAYIYLEEGATAFWVQLDA